MMKRSHTLPRPSAMRQMTISTRQRKYMEQITTDGNYCLLCEEGTEKVHVVGTDKAAVFGKNPPNRSARPLADANKTWCGLNDRERVSRQHFQVEFRKGYFYIRDIGSMNGTFLQRATDFDKGCLLMPGTTVVLDDTELLVPFHTSARGVKDDEEEESCSDANDPKESSADGGAESRAQLIRSMGPPAPVLLKTRAISAPVGASGVGAAAAAESVTSPALQTLNEAAGDKPFLTIQLSRPDSYVPSRPSTPELTSRSGRFRPSSTSSTRSASSDEFASSTEEEEEEDESDSDSSSASTSSNSSSSLELGENAQADSHDNDNSYNYNKSSDAASPSQAKLDAAAAAEKAEQLRTHLRLAAHSSSMPLSAVRDLQASASKLDAQALEMQQQEQQQSALAGSPPNNSGDAQEEKQGNTGTGPRSWAPLPPAPLRAASLPSPPPADFAPAAEATAGASAGTAEASTTAAPSPGVLPVYHTRRAVVETRGLILGRGSGCGGLDLGGRGPKGVLATIKYRKEKSKDSSEDGKFYLVASECTRAGGGGTGRGETKEDEKEIANGAQVDGDCRTGRNLGRFWLRLPASSSSGSSSSGAEVTSQQQQQVAAFRLRDGDLVKCGRSGPVMRVRVCKTPNLPSASARFGCAKDLAASLEPNFAMAEEMQDRLLAVDGFAGRKECGFFAIFDGHITRCISDFVATVFHRNLEEALVAAQRAKGCRMDTDNNEVKTSCAVGAKTEETSQGQAGEGPDIDIGDGVLVVGRNNNAADAALQGGRVATTEPELNCEELESAMRQAYEATNLHVRALGDSAMWAGCTAVTALLWRQRSTSTGSRGRQGKAWLVLGNLGDSRAILCRDRRPMQLSVDHRAKEASEQERVKAAGGKIVNNRLAHCMEVTRAFGDLALASHGMWNQPDVRAVELIEGRDTHVVLCSDGLTDFLDNEEVVGVVTAQSEAQAEQGTRKLRSLPQASRTVRGVKSKRSVFSSAFFQAPPSGDGNDGGDNDSDLNSKPVRPEQQEQQQQRSRPDELFLEAGLKLQADSSSKSSGVKHQHRDRTSRSLGGLGDMYPPSKSVPSTPMVLPEHPEHPVPLQGVGLGDQTISPEEAAPAAAVVAAAAVPSSGSSEATTKAPNIDPHAKAVEDATPRTPPGQEIRLRLCVTAPRLSRPRGASSPTNRANSHANSALPGSAESADDAARKKKQKGLDALALRWGGAPLGSSGVAARRQKAREKRRQAKLQAPASPPTAVGGQDTQTKGEDDDGDDDDEGGVSCVFAAEHLLRVAVERRCKDNLTCVVVKF